MEEKMYSAREVAEKFGVGEPAARGWARDGLLHGTYQVGRTWVIPASALEGFTPPKRGRPLEGQGIRFKLPAKDAEILVLIARQADVSPSEAARKIVVEALQAGG